LLQQIEPQQGQRNDRELQVVDLPKSRQEAAREAGMSATFKNIIQEYLTNGETK
jgi:hypothetical protein